MDTGKGTMGRIAVRLLRSVSFTSLTPASIYCIVLSISYVSRKHLGRCNAADGPASLRCNALFWGGLRPLRCCVASSKVLYYSSLSHSQRLSGNSMGGKRKKEGVTVKIGLENSSTLIFF